MIEILKDIIWERFSSQCHDENISPQMSTPDKFIQLSIWPKFQQTSHEKCLVMYSTLINFIICWAYFRWGASFLPHNEKSVGRNIEILTTYLDGFIMEISETSKHFDNFRFFWIILDFPTGWGSGVKTTIMTKK